MAVHEHSVGVPLDHKQELVVIVFPEPGVQSGFIGDGSEQAIWFTSLSDNHLPRTRHNSPTGRLLIILAWVAVVRVEVELRPRHIVFRADVGGRCPRIGAAGATPRSPRASA